MRVALLTWQRCSCVKRIHTCLNIRMHTQYHLALRRLQTNEAIKVAHARLREPPEEAVSEQWWPAGAKGVSVEYDALAARRAARAPRQRALEELGTFWFGSVLVRR